MLGFALWKVLSFLIFPLLGPMLGLLLWILKIVFVVGLVLLLVWWLRRDRKQPKDGEAPAT